jgi:hypothetical protein
MLNIATIAAIVAAVWAHPQGVAYLEKIDTIEQLSISCGNPCCNELGSGQHRARKEEEEKWRNLPEYYQYKPKEKQEIVQLEEHFLPPTENVSPEELVAILKTVVSKIQSPAPVAVYDREEDDEEAILFLMGVLK